MCQTPCLQDPGTAAGSAGSPTALASSSKVPEGAADAAQQQHAQAGQAADAAAADGAPQAPQQQQQQDAGPDIKQEAAAAANPAEPQQQQQQPQQQPQQPLPAGAYTQREEHLQRQEASGEIEFAYVLNDGQPINMIRCAATGGFTKCIAIAFVHSNCICAVVNACSSTLHA
jgi:hypothetical protein